MNTAPTLPRSGWPARTLELLVILVILSLSGLGILYAVEEKQKLEAARLQAIVDLQTRQVADWLREREGDAEMVRISPSLLEEYRLWRDLGDLEAAKRMQARLAPLLFKGGLLAIDLYDPEGRLVWSTSDSPHQTAPELRQSLRMAKQSRRIQRVGPYLDDDGQIHLDYVVPLVTNGGGDSSPLVVLHSGTDDWLCPTLEAWPTLSNSGESFLFRRDGDQVRYLCPLRHQPDAALRLRLPVSTQALLAARLLRGEVQPGETIQGVDYRGVPVLGVAQPIAGTDWFVISKLDLAEIRATATLDILLIALAGGLTLLTVIAGTRIQRHRQRLALTMATQEAQTERLNALERLHESERRFQAIFEQAAVGIAQIAPDGHWQRVNDRLCEILGYDAAELLDKTFQDITHPDDLETDLELVRHLLAGEIEHYTLEKRYIRQDGRPLWCHLTVSLARTPDGRPDYFISVLKDISDRKVMESQLRLWSNVFEKAELNLAMGDAVRQRLLAVNPAFARRRGYRPEEMAGMPTAALFPPDRLEEVRAESREADAKGHHVFETEHLCKNGERFPVLLDITVTHSDDGQLATRIVHALDITARKESERVLRESEERFRAVFNQQFQFMAILDPEGRVIDINELVLRFQGYAREDFIGRRFWESPAWRDHPDWQRIWPERLAQAALMDGPLLTQDIYQMRDGRIRTADAATSAIREPDGTLRWYVIQATDTTERHLAEVALRDSRELLRTLVSSIPDLVWLKDPQGAFLTCNARFESLVGAPEALIIGKSDYDFLPHTLADMCRSSDLATLTAGEIHVSEEWLTFADDSHRELVQVIKSPVYDAGGALIGVLGIGRDITQIKRTEDELERHRHHLEELVVERTTELMAARAEAERLARAKSEFLANMSHEIRTPMNAVLGLAYLLERLDLPKEARELAHKIHLAGRSLLGIINDILDFSKIESGHIEIERAPFRLDEVLDGLATIMTATAGDKSLELVIRPPDCLDCTLLGDSLRLGQVLINLTGNAIKFTASGVVEVGADLLERTESQIRVRFSVRDTGIGIDEATQARLFQPFAQADASTTRRFGGSGLGLVISRRLVELMGGRLEVDSRLGEGSTFRFDLQFEVLDTLSSHLAGTARMRVLIVDDDPCVGDALTATVAALKWSATQVTSGQQALERVRRGTTWQGTDALILLDHRPPALDGLAIAASIRQALPNSAQPLIFLLTSGRRDEVPETSSTVSIDMALSKPLTPSSLHDAVIQVRRQRLGGRPLTKPRMKNERRLAGLRLLVVDDSDINRDVAQRIFSDEGAEVHLANDGREAVDWLIAHPEAVDIVLMDVQMPVMDGRAATRLIRETPAIPRLPIVALTADTVGDQQSAALEAGMDAFLSKPFDVTEAVALILSLTLKGTANETPQPAPVALSPPPNSDLPGLAIDQGLRLWRDPDLYRQYLQRFARDYADSAQSIADADPETARQIVHKLRGTAGSMSLPEVAAQAGILETQLMAGLEISVQPLQDALTTALESIARYAPDTATVIAQPESPLEGLTSPRSHNELELRLREALSAFDRFDPPAAGPALDALAAHLSAEQLAPLRQAIDEFDANAGLTAVRALAATLSIQMEY
ncbi:MAG: PAS domain S-box protein [Chromatiales bacterium]|nr:PAS domain S-box protein [Chromatiales bacterium]